MRRRVRSSLLPLTFAIVLVSQAVGAQELVPPTDRMSEADAEQPPLTPDIVRSPRVTDDNTRPKDEGEGEAKSPLHTDTDRVSMPPDPADVAPTLSGLSGLFHLVTGDIGDLHTFRVGVHTELFTDSDFLVSGDDNTRFIGTLSLSYTPWQYLEVFLGVASQSNSNERDQSDRLDPEVIFALGDFAFGAKGRYPIHKAVTVGGQVALKLLNSVGGVSFDANATSALFGALASFDAGKISSVPLRLHLNAGYLLDNSDKLQRYGSNYSLESLNVEKFAQGINRPRMQLKLGIDSQLRRWTKIGVSPIVELGLDIATGHADSDFARFVGTDITADDFDGRMTSSLTLGVRVNPVRGLAVDLASDIGLVSPGYGHGPPVPPWNVILGLSYAYDPKPAVKVITRTRTIAASDKGTNRGKARGRVVDFKTQLPIEGAVVTFPGKDVTGLSTDPDGGFLSYDFPSGALLVMVRHPGYASAKATAQIEPGRVTELTIALDPTALQPGTVSGAVVGAKTGKALVADVRFDGPETRAARTDSRGRFHTQLKPGAYTVNVSAKGYGASQDSITVDSGRELKRKFELAKRLDQNLVKVTKSRILLRRKIHFASGRSELRPDSQQLLDLVVDALRENPKIKRLQIAGHTDNQGASSYNLRLSQERAESVMRYLTGQGIAATRLEARGYGDTQPKRSNLTTSGRAVNRRVEFKILR